MPRSIDRSGADPLQGSDPWGRQAKADIAGLLPPGDSGLQAAEELGMFSAGDFSCIERAAGGGETAGSCFSFGQPSVAPKSGSGYSSCSGCSNSDCPGGHGSDYGEANRNRFNHPGDPAHRIKAALSEQNDTLSEMQKLVRAMGSDFPRQA